MDTAFVVFACDLRLPAASPATPPPIAGLS